MPEVRATLTCNLKKNRGQYEICSKYNIASKLHSNTSCNYKNIIHAQCGMVSQLQKVLITIPINFLSKHGIKMQANWTVKK
jgi:hypothetical protein